LLIGEIDDQPARQHFLAPFLQDAGFVDTALGYQMRRVTQAVPIMEVEEEDVPESA
jgi:hypothetical protein